MRDICIAAITCDAFVKEVDRNLATTVAWTEKAKQAGADLVCFPELNITGYCNRPEISESALPVPGTATDQLSQLAQEQSVTLLCGVAEHNPAGLPFATHCVFTTEGDIQIYRKLHIAPPEKKSYCAGDRIRVFRTSGICFGIQLCYDAHFPELSSAMTQKGMEVLFVPHASPRGTGREKHQSWLRHLTARAYDNSIFVIACNQIGDNCNGLSFPGNALAISPSGEVIGADTQSRPSMLLVDLKASDLTDVRNHPMRHFFPNRRPEIYTKNPG
jgi:N-carbamoylputrescine amidase